MQFDLINFQASHLIIGNTEIVRKTNTHNQNIRITNRITNI